MPQIYPPWIDHAVRAGLAVAGLSALAVPATLIAWARAPYATGQYLTDDQPVQFDHRHHVGDAGIDCRYCHADAWRSPYAGVPSAVLCMGCHGQVWNGSSLLAPVRQSAATGAPIRWRRVHNLPDFVFFNHAAHVNRGVGCDSCHGRVDAMPLVYPVAPLTMRWCLECHRAPDAHLRPQDAITDTTWQLSHADARSGAALRARLGVSPPTNCTGCHR